MYTFNEIARPVGKQPNSFVFNRIMTRKTHNLGTSPRLVVFLTSSISLQPGKVGGSDGKC